MLVGQKRNTAYCQDLGLDVRKDLKCILKLCDWDLECIYLVQDCEKLQALLYTVISSQFPQNAENFLNRSRYIAFSRNNHIHCVSSVSVTT